MDRHHGYWWSPDGTRLLAARVSEHDVGSWWLSDPADAAAEPYRQRYPFAGTPNPDVRLLLVALDGTCVDVDLPYGELPYLQQVRWDGAGDPLVTLHARDHGRVEVRAVDPGTGATRLVHADTDPAWLEIIPGTPRWLADGGLLVVRQLGRHPPDRHRRQAGRRRPACNCSAWPGSVGDRIIFCATDEPTERHVYALDPRDRRDRTADDRTGRAQRDRPRRPARDLLRDAGGRRPHGADHRTDATATSRRCGRCPSRRSRRASRCSRRASGNCAPR